MSFRTQFDIDFDLDWKPEATLIRTASSSPSDQKIIQAPYKGALTIIEYATDIPQYEVIRDNDKFLMRFPFGGIILPGEKPVDGAKRESREEVGLQLGKMTKDNFIGEFNCGPNCTHFVFAKRLPAELKHTVVLGEEQKDHAAMLETTIDRYISNGMFSPNHANAWVEFKKWRVGKSY